MNDENNSLNPAKMPLVYDEKMDYMSSAASNKFVDGNIHEHVLSTGEASTNQPYTPISGLLANQREQ